ncbi:uncharacterized protein FIBRA_08470 [Fibroporia radiculosa]|uniref:BD-FAE-like domain-containing protein n=1 Tax=Fibroporia radiculosa TaxID=599839 RepID=J4H570_9APHY|nr:uncharacterized protein FIBRA_08470 [Fibroporia radiculosa]CCM06224.1 predicted protein [Fibroporia radiculosa]
MSEPVNGMVGLWREEEGGEGRQREFITLRRGRRGHDVSETRSEYRVRPRDLSELAPGRMKTCSVLRSWLGRPARRSPRPLAPLSSSSLTSPAVEMLIDFEELLAVPYVSQPTVAHNPLHQFDLYVPKSPSTTTQAPPLICFVHGGAWRSEDKAQHAQLARRLAAHTRFPVAIPNYRLSTPATPLRHPAHAEDLLAFLHFVLTWSGPPSSPCPYDPTQLYLLGHSCSAHMLTSIFLQPPESISDPSPSPSPPSSPAASDPSSPPLPPSPIPTPAALSPSPALLASTRALVLSEGLYDFDTLLRAFPAYKSWFIAPTFGRLRSYTPWNTASYRPRPGGAHLRWLVLHSRGDTLVHPEQSALIWRHLKELYAEPQDGDERGTARMVCRDWDTLTEEHNDTLAGEVYPRLVADFVRDDVAWRASDK